MKKDFYRAVLYIDSGSFFSDKAIDVNRIHNGVFHEWAQAGDEDNYMEKFALIEDWEGKIHEVPTNRIKFDKPIRRKGECIK